MYRKHFALPQHPLSPEIAPDDLFPSATARERDVRLTLPDLRGVGLITGDCGSARPAPAVVSSRACTPASIA